MTGRTRNLAFAAVGGALWAVVPALDGAIPWVWSVSPLAPVLVAFGVLECRRRYRAVWGRAGRTGVALALLGLALLAVAAFLQQALAGLVAVFAVAPVAGGGALALWVGSAFLAVALRRTGVLGTAGAVAFALTLPASAILNVVLGPSGVGVGTTTFTVGLGLYGVAWVALAARLYSTRESTVPERASATDLETGSFVGSPQRVVAGVVGLAFAILGVLGVVPLGAPSGTPFTGETALLDATHAALGAAGILAAVAGGRYAPWYNAIAGAAFVALAALPFFPGPSSFGLVFVDLVVYVPAAVVALGVAATAGSGPDSGRLSSGDGDVRDRGEEADDEGGSADRDD